MNIIIVDDDSLVAGALKTILEINPDINITATGSDGQEACELYRRYQPDILLMDIRMKNMSGLEASALILKEFPDARILLLTTFSDDEYIIKALRLGAKGYLLKQDYASILPALRAVFSGQTVFGTEIVARIPQLLHSSPSFDYNACDINFLEGIFSKKGSSNITGNCYHRNRVHTRGGNSGYQVGCTWAGSCQTHADLSCCTGVTVCCVGSSLLMGSKYMFNFITVSVKGVINVQNSSAWISENGIHALLQQTFYDDLRSCKLQFHFLLVYYTVKIPDICYERTMLS